MAIREKEFDMSSSSEFEDLGNTSPAETLEDPYVSRMKTMMSILTELQSRLRQVGEDLGFVKQRVATLENDVASLCENARQRQITIEQLQGGIDDLFKRVSAIESKKMLSSSPFFSRPYFTNQTNGLF